MTGAVKDPGVPDNTPGTVPDNETTLIYGPEEEYTHISPEEMRQELQLPEGRSISDYGTLRTIGVGGMGAVFSAREPGLKRDVALKILRPQYRRDQKQVAAFIREARATARIDHPNIVPVHHLGVFDEVGVYFSMKRVEGETLRVILRHLADDRPGYRRKYSLPRLLEIFIGACNGVAFAHRHGIIHRDLKPGNLMIGDYGEVMVMDWGMAFYRDDLDDFKSGGEGNSGRIAAAGNDDPPGKLPPENGDTNHRGGTLAFMPPERLLQQSQGLPSVAGDIYSLGCILYSILTWRPAPFEVEMEPEKLAAAVCTGRFISPRRAAPPEQPTPRELEAICLKAMATDPDRRYSTVEDMLDDLRDYLAGYPVKAYSPTLLYRFGKMIYRHPLIPAVLAAAAVAWVSFSTVMHFNHLITNTSLLNIARYHYTQGQSFERSLLHRLDTIQQENQDDTTIPLAADTVASRLLFHMKHNYSSALENLYRMQDTSGGGLQQAYHLGGEICRSIFNIHLRTGEYRMIRAELDNMRSRNREFLAMARAANRRFDRQVELIDRGTGSLKIAVAGERATDWKLRVLPLDGDNRPDPERAIDIPLQQAPAVHELPYGNCIFSFTPPAGEVLSSPAAIPLAGSLDFVFEPPPANYPDRSFVPAAGKSDKQSFFIGRKEVSIGEYLKFWRQLPTPELRRLYRAHHHRSPGDPEPVPLWDDNGRLRPPLTPELPVSGISIAAAEAYCRFRSKELGTVVRLPCRREWEWAARGRDRRASALLADSPEAARYPAGAPGGSFPGDVSVFGVSDMTGNVREWLNSPDGKKTGYGIAGGSFATPSRFARSDFRQYSIDGGAIDDVGFRCVYEIRTAGEKTGSAVREKGDPGK